MEQGEINIACSLKGDKGKYSEMMIRHSSGSWCIGRLILDPFTAKLYSSKAEDVMQIKAMTNSGYTTQSAIEHLINREHL